MRLEVSIPDPLFDGVRRAAAASGISLEAYVADAMQRRLQEDPEDDMAWFFTSERIAELREASAEARNGESISLEAFRSERKEWRANRHG